MYRLIFVVLAFLSCAQVLAHEPERYPGRLADFYGDLILVGISYDKKKAHDCAIERIERE